MSALTITVHGTPAPQGSKRHVGRGVMVESSKLVKPWREAVKHAALDELGDFAFFDGPVCVEVTFTLRKPASAPKRRTTWPSKKPDVDKLLRSTLDALSDAGVWVDDAQVVEVTARKVYPGEGIDSLPHSGAIIHIWPQTDTEQGDDGDELSADPWPSDDDTITYLQRNTSAGDCA